MRRRARTAIWTANHTRPLRSAGSQVEAIPPTNLESTHASARKRGLRAEWPGGDAAAVDAFFRLYAQTMHRLGSPPHSKALFQHVAEAFAGQTQIVLVMDGDDPRVQRRRAICTQCEYKTMNPVNEMFLGQVGETCGVCHCFIRIKTRLSKFRCPIRKWEKENAKS